MLLLALQLVLVPVIVVRLLLRLTLLLVLHCCVLPLRRVSTVQLRCPEGLQSCVGGRLGGGSIVLVGRGALQLRLCSQSRALLEVGAGLIRVEEAAASSPDAPGCMVVARCMQVGLHHTHNASASSNSDS